MLFLVVGGWLVSWLVGWLVGWLAGWRVLLLLLLLLLLGVGCFLVVAGLAGWLAGWLVGLVWFGWFGGLLELWLVCWGLVCCCCLVGVTLVGFMSVGCLVVRSVDMLAAL